MCAEEHPAIELARNLIGTITKQLAKNVFDLPEHPEQFDAP